MTSNARPLVLAPLLLAACLSACALAPASADRAVYLVRHAEKEEAPGDVGLTEAGRARAAVLAERLDGANLEAVYSTDYARTRETAAAVADALGLPVTLYDPGALGDLAATLRTRNETALVVGHSNTTPELARLLGAEPGPPIDDASEHDRLYVITWNAGGAPRGRIERYGD